MFSNCKNCCIQNLWEPQKAAGCHWFPQKFWKSEGHALPSPGHIPSWNPCHQGSEWLHLSLSMLPLKQTPARTRDYKEYCLLLCDTIQYGRYLLMFWRNLLPLSSRQPFWSNLPKNIIYEELIVKFLFKQFSLFLVSPHPLQIHSEHNDFTNSEQRSHFNEHGKVQQGFTHFSKSRANSTFQAPEGSHEASSTTSVYLNIIKQNQLSAC